MIESLKPTLFTIAQLVVIWAWASTYGRVRQERKYSVGRRAVSRNLRFKLFGKIVFVLSNLLTIAGFWSESPLLMQLWHSDLVAVAGFAASFAAIWLHVRSLRVLGDNYSPCFDSHLPYRIVRSGPYLRVRHPVYLANLLGGVGAVMVSGSAWVAFLMIYSALEIVDAIVREEAYLTKAFAEYRVYRAQTARLIPFVF